jgi:hypothetical protein
MDTNTHGRNSTALQVLKRQGYFFQYAAVLTLIVGLYIHVTRLVFGMDLLIKKVVTPRNDMLLAVPMAYTVLFGWLSWKRVLHPSKLHQIAFAAVLSYFTISLPLHIRTYFTRNVDLLRVFPAWFSVLILPLQFLMAVFFWQLQLKKGD